MSDLGTKFLKLCEDVSEVFGRGCGLNLIEPHLLKVLDFSRENPEARMELAECFKKILRDRSAGPLEIVIFCMRELRWPEVEKEATDRLVSSDDLRVQSAMNSVLAVYDDEWEDADFYEYYSDKDAH